MSKHRHRANVADPAMLDDAGLDDMPEGGIKRPLIFVIAMHVIAVIGLIVFAKFNASRAADSGDSANDHRYVEAADPVDDAAARMLAVGELPQDDDPAASRPLTHVVESGQTLQSIARQYGIAVQDLAELNSMQPYEFPATNRVLKLPHSASASALMADDGDVRELLQSAPRATPTTTPTEVDGIPVLRATPAATSQGNASRGGTYTIAPGDTLSKIARANGTTVEALVKANNIADPTKIRPGQKLKLP